MDIPIYILKRGDLVDNTSGACDCVPLTSQQIEAIVSGTYEPEEGEDEPADCGCVPLTADEIIDIVKG